MKRYKNLGGDAGIRAYEIDEGAITIQFEDGSTYRYTDSVTGADHILEMRRLADAGEGLTTYINRFVRERYAKKLR
ncbi:MAG TPA: hypothetical protein VJU83_11000 [Burkholderiales bacterium]|nr:hypothetical protein [Burkholderiales bacterium]